LFNGRYILKIGIPRALLWSIYLPLWKAFFNELGHEVVLSPPTNKKILNDGVTACVDDACLPVKIMHGHVIDLMDRADLIFIPRLISICPREYICPKFIGLPEMIRNSVPGGPKLLVLDFNAHKSIRHGYDGFIAIGRQLGARESAVRRALARAMKAQDEYTARLLGGSNPLMLLEGMALHAGIGGNKGTIGLIGHPYLLYDRFVSMDACRKLAQMGYRLIFPENILPEQIERTCSIYPKKLFWSYGKHLLGSGLAMLEKGMADGIIVLSSFGCGIDSFMVELLQRQNQRDFRIPLTVITLDEHSGNAGFDTRLEAFVDMLEWRDHNGHYFSPHGEGLYIC